MKKTIMIVEDDPKISKLITDYFEEYHLITVDNGASALLEFDQRPIDLIILDIMLPVLDGWEVLKHIRKKSLVPIIVLTAKSDEESNLKGFSLGVDNYVCKPFSPKVLLAKTKALFNRIERAAEKQDETLDVDATFTINPVAHEVIINGQVCSLTNTEFLILLYMSKNKKVALSRNNILDAVWGENYFGDIRIVDTNIKRLREKLGSKAKYISTVRGFGYKFEVN